MTSPKTISPRAICKVAVIGARGQMGHLCVERCHAVGIATSEINRPITRESLAAGLEGADLILLSIPVGTLQEVLSLMDGILKPPQILIDNVSVKTAPLHDMLSLYSGPVVGTHPLFGPVPPKDPQVAIVPGRDEEACAAVEAWNQQLGFNTFRTTAEEHDRAMAHIQGLNFVTTVAYLATLRDEPGITKFMTPSLRRRLDAAKKMILEDADMFATIFEANPYSQDTVRLYRNFLHVAAGGDVEILAERAGWWWREEEKGKK